MSLFVYNVVYIILLKTKIQSPPFISTLKTISQPNLTLSLKIYYRDFKFKE